MAGTRFCQICNGEFGVKVEPGEFVNNRILRAAGVAQICTGCLAGIPEEVKADLRARPKFFARNALAKKRGELNPRDAGVRFPDRRRVINTGGFNTRGL